MAYRLPRKSLTATIDHLCRYGDTDIFPHLAELSFFGDEKDAIVDELSKLDLDSYSPGGAIEALAPKSRYGFRIVHQLTPLDNVLLLASVVEIADKIEARRQPANLARAFSYRYISGGKDGQLFQPDRTYKDWLHRQITILSKAPRVRTIVGTDISDYYARVNFHRLENLLDEVAPSHGAGRFIKKHIKIIRAKQSFGLPVGGSAARMLAELALIDTDQALKDKGLISTRFVDDFRVFLTKDDSAYEAIGFLAEQLGINEGLSLNVAKTTVTTRRDFVQKLDRLTTDLSEEAEGVALDTLTSNVYFDDEPNEEDIEQLKGINLVGLLEQEIGGENWDMGRIKVLFRALKIVKPKAAVDLVKRRFHDFQIFAKELCLLMEALNDDFPKSFEPMLAEVMHGILSPPASSVQLLRTWLIELLVRGVLTPSPSQIKQLEALPSVIDRRQVLLIRGRARDKNFFRQQKTATHQYTDHTLSALVWGASCLPSDEYEKWLDTLKANFPKPLGALYLKWAIKHRTSLIKKLRGNTSDHPA